MNDPKTKSTSEKVGAAVPSGPSPSAPSAPPRETPVPESAEVSAASAANKARQRQDALEEAAKIIGLDVTNSCDQVAHFCRADNQEQIIKAHTLLLQRLVKADALLRPHIEGLHTCDLH
jgi:hypothetical protein